MSASPDCAVLIAARNADFRNLVDGSPELKLCDRGTCQIRGKNLRVERRAGGYAAAVSGELDKTAEGCAKSDFKKFNQQV